MENMRRTCNPMMDFLKFISNKKILSEIIVLGYKQIYCQILYFSKSQGSHGPLPLPFASIYIHITYSPMHTHILYIVIRCSYSNYIKILTDIF